MRDFDVLDAVSLASGGRANEDCFGWSGAFAWVLDGATGLSPRGTRPDCWVRALSASLSARANHVDSLGLLVDLAIPAAAACCGWYPDPELEPHELVSAAGILAHLEDDGRLTLLSFGDCEAAVLFDDGSMERFSDGRLDAWDRSKRPELARLVAKHEGDVLSAYEEYKRGAAAEGRRRMNTPGGYPALTPDGLGVPMATDFHLEGVRRILLFSDGLAWAMDDFALTTPETLLAGLDTLGMTARRLRAQEAADIGQRRVLRGKGSDDATGLLLEIR